MAKWVDYKGRKCWKCNSEYTYTGSGRGPSWFKRYIKDIWTGEYECYHCHFGLKNYKNRHIHIKSDDKYSYAYYKELAKDVGYPHEIKDNIIGPFIKWARENDILVNSADIDRKLYRNPSIEKLGCQNNKEYQDKLAQMAGFKDHSERSKILGWEKGKNIPMSENKECSSYFGVYIGENYVSKLFHDILKMPYGNPGFDWVCNKEKRIDHKASCLLHRDNRHYFEFTIRYNNIADYFILSAWDDRDSLNPLYVWIFHKNDIIREKKFWQRETLIITNRPEYIAKFEKYEITDKLEKLKELCKELKEKI